MTSIVHKSTRGVECLIWHDPAQCLPTCTEEPVSFGFGWSPRVLVAFRSPAKGVDCMALTMYVDDYGRDGEPWTARFEDGEGLSIKADEALAWAELPGGSLRWMVAEDSQGIGLTSGGS